MTFASEHLQMLAALLTADSDMVRLHPTHLIILGVLCERTDVVTMAELAAACAVTTPSIARAVQRLEEIGAVERDAERHHPLVLWPTEFGKQLDARVRAYVGAALRAA